MDVRRGPDRGPHGDYFDASEDDLREAIQREIAALGAG
jgi:hypothetical protein